MLALKARTNPQTKLLNYLQDYIDVFDPIKADKLLECRPGTDYAIKLIKQDKDGRKLEAF